MQKMFLDALLGVLKRLVNERFFARIIVEIGKAIAAKTKSDLDDKIVKAMAEALGVAYLPLRETVEALKS